MIGDIIAFLGFVLLSVSVLVFFIVIVLDIFIDLFFKPNESILSFLSRWLTTNWIIMCCLCGIGIGIILFFIGLVLCGGGV